MKTLLTMLLLSLSSLAIAAEQGAMMNAPSPYEQRLPPRPQPPIYQQPYQQPIYQQPYQQPRYQQPYQQPMYQQPYQYQQQGIPSIHNGRLVYPRY